MQFIAISPNPITNPDPVPNPRPVGTSVPSNLWTVPDWLIYRNRSSGIWV